MIEFAIQPAYNLHSTAACLQQLCSRVLPACQHMPVLNILCNILLTAALQNALGSPLSCASLRPYEGDFARWKMLHTGCDLWRSGMFCQTFVLLY